MKYFEIIQVDEFHDINTIYEKCSTLAMSLQSAARLMREWQQKTPWVVTHSVGEDVVYGWRNRSNDCMVLIKVLELKGGPGPITVLVVLGDGDNFIGLSSKEETAIEMAIKEMNDYEGKASSFKKIGGILDTKQTNVAHRWFSRKHGTVKILRQEYE